MMAATIRVLVVDDHEVFRRGLVALLAEEPDLELVGEAGAAREAVQFCRQVQPDVVLMDIHMPGGSGVEAISDIKSHTRAKILMLTVSEKDQDLLGAINAGADGYLLKNAKPAQLCDAIRNVAAGKGALAPEITPTILRRVARTAGDEPHANISPRESEVLALLARGASTADIANALTISENTVKTHVSRILKKLDAANRAEAVARAVALGLIYNGS